MGDECAHLVGFIDGELGPSTAEEFRAHLESCERCRVDLVEDMQLSARLSMLGSRYPRQHVPSSSARGILLATFLVLGLLACALWALL